MDDTIEVLRTELGDTLQRVSKLEDALWKLAHATVPSVSMADVRKFAESALGGQFIAVTIEPYADDGRDEYVASHSAYLGLTAFGDTESEALHQFITVLEATLGGEESDD